MEEETPITPETEAKTIEQRAETELPNLLSSLDNAPTKDQIDKWKAEYGEVFVSGFSEQEIYVWRPMTRAEYVALQTKLQNPDNQITQFKMEELVCETCVLFPANIDLNKKAGTAGTLSEQIMQNSNFMSAAAASMLVAKL